MTMTSLQNRAYELCLQSSRYEIMPDLVCMDCLQLSGLISYFGQITGYLIWPAAIY
jgi:hypothetical protein